MMRKNSARPWRPRISGSVALFLSTRCSSAVISPAVQASADPASSRALKRNRCSSSLVRGFSCSRWVARNTARKPCHQTLRRHHTSEAKKGEVTCATEGKQCHITMTAVLILEWLCHAVLGCGVQCAAQQWEKWPFLGSELKASQSQSRGGRRRATGSRLISVASGVHAIKHALPVESWPPTRREGCSRASSNYHGNVRLIE